MNWLKRIQYSVLYVLQLPLLVVRKSKVGRDSIVTLGSIIVRSTIGSYTYISSCVVLNETSVGNYCSIASGVKVGGMEHSWWWGSTSPRISDKGISNIRTIIEDDVWIGSNAVVRKGLHIGRGAVIGAGSVVLMDVEPYTIVVGMPAKVIKKRIPDEIIEQITATEFWLYPPPKAKELLLKIDFSNCAIPDYLDTP